MGISTLLVVASSLSCKHGEQAIVCTLCDLETIDRLAPQSPVNMEDWVPEMGWEMEDYE